MRTNFSPGGFVEGCLIGKIPMRLSILRTVRVPVKSRATDGDDRLCFSQSGHIRVHVSRGNRKCAPLP